MSRGETDGGATEAISGRGSTKESRVTTTARVLSAIVALGAVGIVVFWPQRPTPESTRNLASSRRADELEINRRAASNAALNAPGRSPTDSALAARVSELRGVVASPTAASAAKRDAVLDLMHLARERGPELRSEKLVASKISVSHPDGLVELSEADFQGADLAWAVFTKVNLQQANFGAARLHRASLNETNLTAARFDGADCSEANFQGANLQGASFSQATLTRANFRGVDLSGVSGLTTEQVGAACWDETTKLPKAVDPFTSDCGTLP